MGLVNVDLSNFSLDDHKFGCDDPETIIDAGLMARYNSNKQRK